MKRTRVVFCFLVRFCGVGFPVREGSPLNFFLFRGSDGFRMLGIDWLVWGFVVHIDDWWSWLQAAAFASYAFFLALPTHAVVDVVRIPISSIHWGLPRKCRSDLRLSLRCGNVDTSWTFLCPGPHLIGRDIPHTEGVERVAEAATTEPQTENIVAVPYHFNRS